MILHIKVSGFVFMTGLMDYEAALKIDGNNSQLIEDADKLRKIIQSSDPQQTVQHPEWVKAEEQ